MPPIRLGRLPVDECLVPLSCGISEECEPFPNTIIEAFEDTTFIVSIGPSGLERGYTAITGNYIDLMHIYRISQY